MQKSGNPALSKSALDRIDTIDQADKATLSGTIIKTVSLLALLSAGAWFGWRAASLESSNLVWLLWGSLIGASVLAFVTIFVPKLSPFTSPLYAVLEGIMLGVLSQIANEAYGGIVLQAILLTLMVFVSVLVLYTSRIVQVTAKLRGVIIIATGAIILYYLAAFIAGLFGASLPLIYDSGTFGIVASVVVVLIAALNLLLDFDFIERMVNNQAPKVFEWYGAFGLMVTLVWLYIEILRLLGKMRR